MAHNLSFNSATGAAEMMYVGHTPWHRLGTKLNAPPTVEAAIAKAEGGAQ